MSNLMNKILAALEVKLEEEFSGKAVIVSLKKPSRIAVDSEGVVVLLPGARKVVEEFPGYSMLEYSVQISAEVLSRNQDASEDSLNALLKRINDKLHQSSLSVADDLLLSVKSVTVEEDDYKSPGKGEDNLVSGNLRVIVETFEKY